MYEESTQIGDCKKGERDTTCTYARRMPEQAHDQQILIGRRSVLRMRGRRGRGNTNVRSVVEWRRIDTGWNGKKKNQAKVPSIPWVYLSFHSLHCLLCFTSSNTSRSLARSFYSFGVWYDEMLRTPYIHLLDVVPGVLLYIVSRTHTLFLAIIPSLPSLISSPS